MAVPSIDSLADELVSLLKKYDPTSMMYIDNQGNLNLDPHTIRDRISNELLYRFWRIKDKQTYLKQIRDIIQPFIIDYDSWTVTRKIFRGNINDMNDFLIIFESLYQLIEYESNRSNSELFVPDWDYKGKTKRAQYRQITEEFLNNCGRILKEGKEMAILTKILDQLKQGDIFNEICLIINEEEKVRQNIDDLLEHLKDSRKIDEIYDLIGEEVGSSIRMATSFPQALLRACLALLANRDIEIASGLQHEALILLGVLKDLRSTDSLLKALNAFDHKYVNLRCALIYALGNLKQKKALNQLSNVLAGPDFIIVKRDSDASEYKQSLSWEKREAIWALGKLGAEAVKALPELIKYSNNPDQEVRLSLAWAMGMIGKGQRERFGGLSADVVITLMQLLIDRDIKIFEEAALSLKSLGLPDFIHSLYLNNIATVPILALKPSSIGLYELSETLLYLQSLKKPVVMAVTGDSGTGKTYFCESIINGFGELKKDDILYLARDNPEHNKIFNRILGIKLLKDYVNPQFYTDYPLTEKEDEPDIFFDNFIKDHADKKLIILDGWRDEVYFHHIVRIFYEKGYLDIMVKFQTTYSTRRINLEERERSLERVRTCLAFLEAPVIEETRFYREGKVLIYNLDNSIPSRLNRPEILEVFQRRKVDTWGDYIRVGRFNREASPLEIDEEALSSRWENAKVDVESIDLKDFLRFSADEAGFTRILNEDLEKEPNLLQIIKLDQFELNRIVFYMPGQIAYCGYDGSIGIFSGLHDRIFYAGVHKKEVIGLAVIGDDIVSFDVDGVLKITSFYKNMITNLGRDIAPACSITTDRTSQIVTGHRDGTIRIWNTQSGQVRKLRVDDGPVLAVAIGQGGRIFTGDARQLMIWDVENKKVKILNGLGDPIKAIGSYPDGRIVIGLGDEHGKEKDCARIKIVNFNNDECKILRVGDIGIINSINVYFDGRIIAGTKGAISSNSKGSLFILDPRSDFYKYKILSGHAIETKDCITMGPRIITGGCENNYLHTLRIWGTELYVKVEHDKLKLLDETMPKPSYYRTLF